MSVQFGPNKCCKHCECDPDHCNVTLLSVINVGSDAVYHFRINIDSSIDFRTVPADVSITYVKSTEPISAQSANAYVLFE